MLGELASVLTWLLANTGFGVALRPLVTQGGYSSDEAVTTSL